ncbi:MAG: hypothetical protein QOG36_1529 [Actinomycetota bacterium]|jgi:hypothetical protein|nr:hypothetical protein [Actinomycetota bacterium]
MFFQLFHTHRVPGALVLTAVLALALPGCSKSHKKPAAQPKASATPTPSPSPSPSPPEASANFVANGVAAVDSQDRPAANAVANDVATHVLATLNEFYNIGFLHPSRWGGGSFPDLQGLFTPDARYTVAPNLPTLSLGPVANVLAKVDPTLQHAGIIAVLIEQNQGASYATVSTRFEGKGTPTDKAADPISVGQSAQFMIDVGNGYRIAGYDITTQIDSVAKSASYHPPGTLALEGQP